MLLVYVLALAPGCRSGSRCSAGAMPAGWIAGALVRLRADGAGDLGADHRLGMPSPLTFAGAWLAVAVARVAGGARRRARRWSRCRTGRRAIRAALASVWLLTLAIAVPPFSRAGATDADGQPALPRLLHRGLRLAHGAHGGAGEVRRRRRAIRISRTGRFTTTGPTSCCRPRSPARRRARAATTSQTCLKVNAVATALLFVSAIFLCAWTALPRAWPVAAGVALAIVASSAEGVVRAVAVLAARRPARRGPQSEHRRARQLVAPTACASTACSAASGGCRSTRWRTRSASSRSRSPTRPAARAPASAIALAGVALGGSDDDESVRRRRLLRSSGASRSRSTPRARGALRRRESLRHAVAMRPGRPARSAG